MFAATHVLVVSGPEGPTVALLEPLNDCVAHLTIVDTLVEAERLVTQQHFDAVIHQADHLEQTAELLTGIHKAAPSLPQLLITGAAPTATWLAQLPTRPYCVLPATAPSMTLHSALAGASALAKLQASHEKLVRQWERRGTREIIGHSAAISELRHDIATCADDDRPTLITGEHGSGKLLAAQAIHDCGPRAHRPLIRIDCSLLTAAHLERELFGTVETASWRGIEAHPGRFEEAAGGTLVIQNIDELSLMLQASLARALRMGQFQRCGETGYRVLDTRVLTTCSHDLKRQSEHGLFSGDLLSAFDGGVVKTPSLRDRREDIAPLAEHFLRNVALKQGRPAKRMTVSAMELLAHYPWPGNVRELENLIDRVCTMDEGPQLTADMVRPWLNSPDFQNSAVDAEMSLKEMERKLIESTFARFAGNREKTAQALQIGLRTLSGKLREYGYPPRGGPGSNQPHNRAA